MKKSTFILLSIGLALAGAACAVLQITLAKQSLYDPEAADELL